MDFCNRYHYDKPPFDGEYEQISSRNARLLDEMTKLARVYPGLYLINGSKGVGKSHFLEALYNKLDLNELCVPVEASSRTDIIGCIADTLKLKKRSEHEVLVALESAHKIGANVILAIDDSDELSDKELANLAGLLSAVPFIRIFAVNGKKLLKRSAPKEFRRALVKSYRLRHLSLFEGAAFMRSISYKALALSQYDNPLTPAAAFLLSFMGNRNVGNLLKLGKASVEDAGDKGLPEIGAKSALNAGWANKRIVMDNLHQKLSKLFIGLMVLLCIYFGARIIYDRQATLTELDLRRNIEEHERKIGQ